MIKEIAMSINCKNGCTKKHTITRDHTVMQIKRFKNRLNQFFYVDDDHWLPAFSLQHQLDDLIQTIKKIKDQFSQKIIEKRLSYALGFETDSKVVKIFRLANSDSFQDLSCEDIAIINKKIQKNRQPKSQEIKALINILMGEEKKRLNQEIASSFSLFKDNEEQEVQRSKPNNPQRQQEQQRPQRREPKQYRRDNREKQDNRNVKSNDLPTIRIEQVNSTQGHFNIALKVINVRKEFVLGQSKRKIEFEGGDQTGVATVVVDCLKMIKTGATVFIHNAKVFSFHGVKQIQQNLRNSYLQEYGRDIKVSDKFNLSEGKKRRYNNQYRDQRGGGERQTAYQRERESLKQKEQERQKYRQKQQQNKSNRYTIATEKPQRRDNLETTKDEVRQERVYRGNRADRDDREDREDKIDREQQHNRSYMSRREERPKELRNRDNMVTNKVQNKVEMVRTQAQREQPVKREAKKQSEQSGYISSEEAEEQKKPPQRNAKQEERRDPVINDKKLTKIKDIEPDMVEETISIMAEVCQITPDVKVSKNSLFAILGDQTGTIWAQLPQHHPAIRVNAVLYLKEIEVNIHEDEHKLILRLVQDSTIQKTNMRMTKINIENDMSEQAWIEDEEEEEKEEKKEAIVEDF